MDDLKKLEELARAILTEETGVKDLRISGVQQLAEAPEGNKVYVFTGASERDWNAPLASVALSARSERIPIDSILGKKLDSVFPAGTDFEVTPIDVPIPTVTIDPPVNILELDACEVFTERIRVTIPASTAVSKADIYFLADTTGSMSGILKAVQSGASSILSSLAGLGLDIAYGVGNYKDFPRDPYAFQHQLNPTTVQTDVQNAINTWSASGGFDTAEGEFFALDQLAQPPGGSIGWRSGSKRIIVWFGDAPSHDPICQAIWGGGYDITEISVTNKLVAEQIVVMAVSTGTGPGLDANPVPLSSDYNGVCGAPGGSAGQATRIATATGGQHVVGIDAGTIVATIINLVQTAINTINSVTLVPTGGIAPFVTSITPPSYGPLDGRRENILDFTVTFTGGAAPCTDMEQVFTGTIDVVIDGVVRAQKPTRITQPPCGYTYSVKFVCGMYDSCDCSCAPVQPGIYSTEINIQNPHCTDVVIDRSITAVVRNGVVVARDPSVASPVTSIRPLRLPPNGATMEDCCWIQSHLASTPMPVPIPDTRCASLNIGFVVIRSRRPLAVTAVYTVSDMNGKCVSMDVETYQPISA